MMRAEKIDLNNKQAKRECGITNATAITNDANQTRTPEKLRQAALKWHFILAHCCA